jgi:hypothetical protein
MWKQNKKNTLRILLFQVPNPVRSVRAVLGQVRAVPGEGAQGETGPAKAERSGGGGGRGRDQEGEKCLQHWS